MSKTQVKYDDMPKSIREALAMHEILRRLRFTPDELFVQLGADVRGKASCVFVVLRTQGKEMIGNAGLLDVPAKDFAELWASAVGLWNGSHPTLEISRTTRARIYEESHVLSLGSIALIAALGRKGITLPPRPPEAEPAQSSAEQPPTTTLN